VPGQLLPLRHLGERGGDLRNVDRGGGVGAVVWVDPIVITVYRTERALSSLRDRLTRNAMKLATTVQSLVALAEQRIAGLAT
jgi:hypothetical protein